MKLDDILTEWEKDAPIDLTILTIESSESPKLHSKYLRYLAHERISLKALEFDLDKLKNDKENFFFFGPDEETIAKGWELPPKGRITVKEEVKRLVSVDKEVVDLSMKVAIQREKVFVLESIVNMISKRSFEIKNIIEHKKFEAGM